MLKAEITRYSTCKTYDNLLSIHGILTTRLKTIFFHGNSPMLGV